MSRFIKAVKEEFKEIVRAAFKDGIRELVNRRLTSALEVTSEKPADPLQERPEGDAVTTQEEIEGFYIVRSILRPSVKSDRVVMRDAKSYCAILLDDNNRKPIARLDFNRSVKYLGLFLNKNEERVRIESLDDIYREAYPSASGATRCGDRGHWAR
jgi:predicted type IV restriction endonuclease